MDLTPKLENAAQRAFKNISARLAKVRMSKKEFDHEVTTFLIDECGLDDDDYDTIDAVYFRVVALMGDKMPTNAPPPPPPSPASMSKGGANLKPRPVPGNQDQALIKTGIENIPYCFIPLSEKVVYAPEAVTNGVMDTPLEGGLSGTITLDWVFETPMLIGETKEEAGVATPFKLGKHYAIPGATLRGHIRHLMETITAARLTKLNRQENNQEDNGVEKTLYSDTYKDAEGKEIPRHKPNPAKPDMVEALFGHVYEPNEIVGAKTDDKKEGGEMRGVKKDSTPPAQVARKGRIAFSFALLKDETPAKLWSKDNNDPHSAVMMAPKGEIKSTRNTDENSDIVEFPGRKSYFPRFKRNSVGVAPTKIKLMLSKQVSKKNKDAVSNMRFLVPEVGSELRFTGEIRVHNVLSEELGALLYALTFGGDKTKRHMIGRAKPQGAGQARVEKVCLRLECNDDNKIINSSGCEPYIESFRKHINEQIPNWEHSTPLKELLNAAEPDLRWNEKTSIYQ